MTDRSGGDDNVVALPVDPPPPVPQPPPTPPRGWHAVAIAGMALSALAGVATLLAFITVEWPADARGVLIGAFVVSVVGFIACSALAVFSAAREPRSEDDS